MKTKTKLIIAGILVVGILFFLLPPLPKFPEKGGELDIKKLGENFWVRLYLAVLPSPMPGYPSLLLRDTVWEAGGSPHRIKSNLLIAGGVTLTIEPGAEIRLDPDVKITCMGRIIARGTAERPIVFKCREKGRHWDLIECNHGQNSGPADDGLNIFTHCVFSGGRGLTVRASSANVEHSTFTGNVSSPIRFEFSAGRIAHNIIYGNSTENEAASGNGAGIMVYSDKEVLVSHNVVYKNRSVGGRDGGGGIYAFAYDRGRVAVLDNTIHDNYSDRNGGGLVAYECRVERNRVFDNQALIAGGGIYAIRSRLKDNRIENNRSGQGGGVYAENCLVSGNLVDANTAPPGSGAGLYYFGNGRIEKNLFTRNQSPPGEAGETIMISGGPKLSANNIIPARGFALRVSSHSLSPDVDAEGNYWGTGDPAIIEGLVYDWLDHSEVGMVTWDGFSPDVLGETPPVPEGVHPSLPTDRKDLPRDGIAGAVNSDMTLGSAEGGRWKVSGNLLVRRGYTITILPGTILEMAPGAHIRVRGRLVAAGTAQKPILITGDPERPWGAILIESRSDLEEMAGSLSSRDKCILRHCTVENGHGVQMEGAGGTIDRCLIRNHLDSGVMVREAAARISDSQITGNRGGKNGGGIYAYSSFPVVITGNRIIGNESRGDGGGVFAYGYQSNAAIHVAENTIEANRCFGQGGGVWATRSSIVDNHLLANQADGQGGGIFASFALIIGNRILENRGLQGGGLFAETNSTLESNLIAGNEAQEDLGGGAYLNFWGMSIKNEVFRNNRVVGNRAPVTGGVYLNGSMIFEGNAIHDNQGFQLHNGNPAGEESFAAPNCYWGACDGDGIDQAIYDQLDDPDLSRVVYEPFAAKASKGLP